MRPRVHALTAMPVAELAGTPMGTIASLAQKRHLYGPIIMQILVKLRVEMATEMIMRNAMMETQQMAMGALHSAVLKEAGIASAEVLQGKTLAMLIAEQAYLLVEDVTTEVPLMAMVVVRFVLSRKVGLAPQLLQVLQHAPRFVETASELEARVAMIRTQLVGMDVLQPAKLRLATLV